MTIYTVEMTATRRSLQATVVIWRTVAQRARTSEPTLYVVIVKAITGMSGDATATVPFAPAQADAVLRLAEAEA